MSSHKSEGILRPQLLIHHYPISGKCMSTNTISRAPISLVFGGGALYGTQGPVCTLPFGLLFPYTI